MTGPDAPARAGRNALVAQYEALRAGVLTAHGVGSRLGLILVRRAGLAAWIEAWASGPAAGEPPLPEPRQADARGADTVHADVVHVLASMALSGLEEGHA